MHLPPEKSANLRYKEDREMEMKTGNDNRMIREHKLQGESPIVGSNEIALPIKNQKKSLDKLPLITKFHEKGLEWQVHFPVQFIHNLCS